MGFQDAVRTCLKEKYVTFSGRAARSEYWYFVLFYIIVIVAIVALFFIVGGMRALETGQIGVIHWILIAAYVLFALAMILPSISAMVRRFHDRDMSGWWVLGVMVLSQIPFVGILVSIGSIVILALKGTDGENRFGEDPLNPSSGADVFS